MEWINEITAEVVDPVGW